MLRDEKKEDIFRPQCSAWHSEDLVVISARYSFMTAKIKTKLYGLNTFLS